nr:hypothetical protein [Pandoravirus belohorizontensis]
MRGPFFPMRGGRLGPSACAYAPPAERSRPKSARNPKKKGGSAPLCADGEPPGVVGLATLRRVLARRCFTAHGATSVDNDGLGIATTEGLFLVTGGTEAVAIDPMHPRVPDHVRHCLVRPTFSASVVVPLRLPYHLHTRVGRRRHVWRVHRQNKRVRAKTPFFHVCVCVCCVRA